MTDKPMESTHHSRLEETTEDRPLSPAEIEVHLAIADFVIRRVNATRTGEAIFEGLIKRFENRYPHHKLLSNCLLCPGYLVPDPDDDEYEDIPLNQLDAKLLEMLRHPEKSLEPLGPLAGAVRPDGWFVEKE